MTNQESNQKIEFAATVKWFDRVKKYGFITDEDTKIEIYVSLIVLVQHGIFCLTKDTYLEGIAEKNDQGYIVTEIHSVDPERIFDQSTAKALSKNYNMIPEQEKTPLDIQITGSVENYNVNKGFGFIKADDANKNIFIHISCIEKCNIPIKKMKKGQKVLFKCEENERGITVSSISLV